MPNWIIIARGFIANSLSLSSKTNITSGIFSIRVKYLAFNTADTHLSILWLLLRTFQDWRKNFTSHVMWYKQVFFLYLLFRLLIRTFLLVICPCNELLIASYNFHFFRNEILWFCIVYCQSCTKLKALSWNIEISVSWILKGENYG